LGTTASSTITMCYSSGRVERINYRVSDKKDSKIKDNIVGRTKFFLLYIKTETHTAITINLIKSVDSNKAPAGKIIILEIKAAKIEYAT
jgi:hypothetical protein